MSQRPEVHTTRSPSLRSSFVDDQHLFVSKNRLLVADDINSIALSVRRARVEGTSICVSAKGTEPIRLTLLNQSLCVVWTCSRRW